MKTKEEIEERREAIQDALHIETNKLEYIYARGQVHALAWVLRNNK